MSNNIIINIGNKHYETVCSFDNSSDINGEKTLTTSFSDSDEDIKNMLKFSIKASSDKQNRISKELYRKEIFNYLVDSIIKYLKNPYDNLIPNKIKNDELFKMIQMYLLNKIISRKDQFDDFVIVQTECNSANDQLEKDIKFKLNEYKISIEPKELNKKLKLIKDFFQHTFKNKGCLIKYNFSNTNDGEIAYDKLNNKFIYSYSIKNHLNDTYINKSMNIPIYPHVIPIIDSLSNDMIIKYICCYIRYEYLNLNTIALAFDYKNDILTKNLNFNNTLEAFASLFNHYYKNWCSAFCDIEDSFGSLGSFFNLSIDTILKYENVVINPPFDESFITKSLMIVENCLNQKKNSLFSNTRFIIIIVHWEDLPIIHKFKLKYNYKVYKKGELEFIDYFDKMNRIKPCDIIIFDLK